MQTIVEAPKDSVNALETPMEVCESLGERLATLLADPGVDRDVLQVAREVAAVRLGSPAAERFAQLCAQARARRRKRSRERVILGASGDELLRIRRQRGTVVFQIPVRHLSRDLLATLERAVAGIFGGEPVQFSDGNP